MNVDTLLPSFILQRAIRNFFTRQGFLDVLTPPIVENPGMETHIHPFQIASAKDQKLHPLYLHTSPEFHMKELLSKGLNKIFTMSYCFRDEPKSSTHRAQFIMLEWYRGNENYFKIMDDCEKLIHYSLQELKKNKIPVKTIGNIQKKTMSEVFHEVLQVDLFDLLEKNSLRQYIKNHHPHIHLSHGLNWEDLFFLLFLNEIEPELKKYGTVFLYEFPAQLAALSTLKKDDPRVCERFEIYIDGIELCNCFNELTDLDIQKKRFDIQAEEKNKLYSYRLPPPNILYNALSRGIPPSSGIALGVERLLMALTSTEDPFWD